MGVYIISDHIQIKLWKKCSVEFFSPAFAKCQTSKMLPTEVNCLIPRKNTLLIFICYQDTKILHYHDWGWGGCRVSDGCYLLLQNNIDTDTIFYCMI